MRRMPADKSGGTTDRFRRLFAPLRRLVPGEVGLGIALGARIVRHAAARQRHGAQIRALSPPAPPPRRTHNSARWWRRQIGIDRDRQRRIVDAEMGQWDAYRIVDLHRAGEGRVEPLAVQCLDDLQADLTRYAPVELRPAKCPFALPPTCTVKAGATW